MGAAHEHAILQVASDACANDMQTADLLAQFNIASLRAVYKNNNAVLRAKAKLHCVNRLRTDG